MKKTHYKTIIKLCITFLVIAIGVYVYVMQPKADTVEDNRSVSGKLSVGTLSNPQIFAVPIADSNNLPTEGVLQPDGSFYISNLTQGSYELTFYNDGSEIVIPGPSTFDQGISKTIMHYPGGELDVGTIDQSQTQYEKKSVKVTLQSLPTVNSLSLDAQNIPQSGYLFSFKVDNKDQGSCVFEQSIATYTCLVPDQTYGDHDIIYTSSGVMGSTHAKLSVDPSSSTEVGYLINSASFTVKGKLIDSATKKPIIGGNITLTPNPDSIGNTYTTISDSSGIFSFEQKIPSGIYDISISASNYKNQTVSKYTIKKNISTTVRLSK